MKIRFLTIFYILSYISGLEIIQKEDQVKIYPKIKNKYHPFEININKEEEEKLNFSLQAKCDLKNQAFEISNNICNEKELQFNYNEFWNFINEFFISYKEEIKNFRQIKIDFIVLVKYEDKIEKYEINQNIDIVKEIPVVNLIENNYINDEKKKYKVLKIEQYSYFKKLKGNNFEVVFEEGTDKFFKYSFSHNYLILKLKSNIFLFQQRNSSFYLFDKQTGLKSKKIYLFLENPLLTSKDFFLKFFFLFIFMGFTFFTVFLILLISLQYEKPEIIIESRNLQSKVLSDSIINWSKSSISDQKTKIENNNLKFNYTELNEVNDIENSNFSEKQKFIINENEDDISVISTKHKDSKDSFFDGIQFK